VLFREVLSAMRLNEIVDIIKFPDLETCSGWASSRPHGETELPGAPYRRPRGALVTSCKTSAGTTDSTLHTSMNSTTSRRLSPASYFETKD